MSHDYYAYCAKCKRCELLWTMNAGGWGPSADPDTMSHFLMEHHKHGLQIRDEHTDDIEEAIRILLAQEELARHPELGAQAASVLPLASPLDAPPGAAEMSPETFTNTYLRQLRALEDRQRSQLRVLQEWPRTPASTTYAELLLRQRAP